MVSLPSILIQSRKKKEISKEIQINFTKSTEQIRGAQWFPVFFRGMQYPWEFAWHFANG